MKNLDRRTTRLIAVGASIAANCQPCLKATVEAARQDKIKDDTIIEAIGIGKMVRHCAAAGLDEIAATLAGVRGSEATQSNQGRAASPCARGPRKK